MKQRNGEIMQTIQFKVGAHEVLIRFQGKGKGGVIETDFKAGDGDSEGDDAYDHAIDGIESLLLAHAVAGVDVRSPQYVQGLEVALETMANHFL